MQVFKIVTKIPNSRNGYKKYQSLRSVDDYATKPHLWQRMN